MVHKFKRHEHARIYVQNNGDIELVEEMLPERKAVSHEG